VVVSLGTCGGVSKEVSKLDIILPKKTIQYDVIQRFGTPSIRFKRSLKADVKISWIDLGGISDRLHIGTIASADQDLCPKARKILKE
jgi:nucleoside phosphorylase